MSARKLSTLVLGALLASAPALAADVTVRGVFSGTQVVSATDSPGTGEVSAVLGDDNDMLVDLVYAGLADAVTGAALHTGRANENGTRVASVDVPADTTEGEVRQATLSLSPEAADRVRAGEAYFVLTTLPNPDGEVRAQLVPQPARLDDLADD
jgi:hypothetical protein